MPIPPFYVTDEIDHLVPPVVRQSYLDLRYTKLATICDPIHFITPLSVWTLSPVAPLSLRLCYYVHLALAARSLKHTDTQQRLESRAQSLASALAPSIDSFLSLEQAPHERTAVSGVVTQTVPSSNIREVLEIAIAALTVARYHWGINASLCEQYAAVAQRLFSLLRAQPYLSPYTDILSLLTYQIDTAMLDSGARPVNDQMRRLLVYVDNYFNITSPDSPTNPDTSILRCPLLSTQQMPPSWTYVPSAVPPPEHARSVQWSLLSPTFVPAVPAALVRGLAAMFLVKDKAISLLFSASPTDLCRTPLMSAAHSMQCLSVMEELECLTTDLPAHSWLQILLAYLRSAVMLAAGNSSGYVASATRATRLLEHKVANNTLAFAPAFFVYPLYFASYMAKCLGIKSLIDITDKALEQTMAMFPDQQLYLPAAYELARDSQLSLSTANSSSSLSSSSSSPVPNVTELTSPASPVPIEEFLFASDINLSAAFSTTAQVDRTITTTKWPPSSPCTVPASTYPLSSTDSTTTAAASATLTTPNACSVAPSVQSNSLATPSVTGGSVVDPWLQFAIGPTRHSFDQSDDHTMSAANYLAQSPAPSWLSEFVSAARSEFLS